MKRLCILTVLAVAVFFLSNGFAQEGQSTSDAADSGAKPDMVQAQTEADEDLSNAQKEAAEKEKEILADRQKLTGSVGDMEKEKKSLLETIAAYEKRFNANEQEIERMNKRLEEQKGDMDEVTGSVRGIAQDLKLSLQQSMVSGFKPGREQVLTPLLGDTEFPSLENIQEMAELLFDELKQNGAIAVATLPFMDAGGRPTTGEVTRIGTFNALYRTDSEVGYLEYAPGKQSFHVVAAEIPRSMKKAAAEFLKGSTPSFYIDLTGGGAFRQLTDMPSWTEEIASGGVLMYPILGLGALAVLLIFERLLVLLRESKAVHRLAGEVTPVLQKLDWSKAQDITKQNTSTLARVLDTGIRHRDMETEVLEAVMEEEIQGVLPRLERNMRFLQIIAVVSPLLGLLGTVTGMIATFQMITLYGTGDPKVMSGGISEALVTTEYGLIVAIPIMLVHGYLSGKLDRIVSLLEEKSIMFVNVVNRHNKREAEQA